MTHGTLARLAGRWTPCRPRPVGTVVGLSAALLAVITVGTAPQPPGPGQWWRWGTILTGLALCGWNASGAYRSFRSSGPLAPVGYLHLWCLLAFSFPIAEMCYRYSRLGAGRWRMSADDPLLLRAALLIAAFQLLFFAALGRGVDARFAARLAGSRASRPDRRLAALLLALAVPFLLARLYVLRDLGVQGAFASAVTRTDYFGRLDSAVNPLVWLPNAVFTFVAVSLLCLAVKYAVPHPSRTGLGLHALTLVGCVAGVALSGGRADLAFVVFTVVAFAYVQGYRRPRHLGPLLVPVATAALLLVLIAQARTGGSNVLSRAAGDPEVGDSYSAGDVTQVLGLGRFDAVAMILDEHDPSRNLGGVSYLHALAGGANSTFAPRLLLGQHLPIWRVGDRVMGPWVYGREYGGLQASAPGELYLNGGLPAVLCGALLLGLAARLLLGAVLRLPGPAEFAGVLALWTLGRALSDESYNTATFAGRTWPVLLLVSVVVLRRAPTRASAAPGSAPPPGHVAAPAGPRVPEEVSA